jgi:hypothetical protein
LEFSSTDIGYVGFSGESYEALGGVYYVQGSGADIWSSSDAFHYMFFETSGDSAFTMLIENFSTNHAWSKVGVSYLLCPLTIYKTNNAF